MVATFELPKYVPMGGKKGEKQRHLHGKFYDYLLKLGLFRMSIRSDNHSVYAALHDLDVPNISDFTQIGEDEGQPIVRLAKVDFKNEAITKGFSFE